MISATFLYFLFVFFMQWVESYTKTFMLLFLELRSPPFISKPNVKATPPIYKQFESRVLIHRRPFNSKMLLLYKCYNIENPKSVILFGRNQNLTKKYQLLKLKTIPKTKGSQNFRWFKNVIHQLSFGSEFFSNCAPPASDGWRHRWHRCT